MTGRELVFSNPVVIRMVTERFVPVAADVTGLQQSDDEEGRFFRHVAVQGLMKGRSRPGVSHQGIYAFAADGTSMASANPLAAEETLALLEKALSQWQIYLAGRDDDRVQEIGPASASHQGLGYPSSGGAVLRMTARDLPRPGDSPFPDGQEHLTRLWNFDHVWLRAQDVRQLLPSSFEIGTEHRVPASLVTRIARFHLRDIVRGEPGVWQPDAVKRADLTAKVVGRDDNRVALEYSGSILLQEHVAFQDSHKPIDWEFDNELDLAASGEGVWCLETERFERLDLLVAGQRSGAHRYNVRTQDPGPAPIGFSFELAGDEAWERTPPHAIRTWTRPGETSPPVATTVTDEPYYG